MLAMDTVTLRRCHTLLPTDRDIYRERMHNYFSRKDPGIIQPSEGPGMTVAERIRAFEKSKLGAVGKKEVKLREKPCKKKPRSKAFDEFEHAGVLIEFGKGTPKKKADDDEAEADPEHRHEEEEEDEADSMGSLDYKAASSSLSKSGGGPEESDRSMSLSQASSTPRLTEDEGIHTMDSDDESGAGGGAAGGGATGGVGTADFAAVSRNCEVLKSFRRAPPPKNRTRARRSLRHRAYLTEDSEVSNFFRSMGLDDLDEDSPSTSSSSVRLPTTSASTSNVCASSTATAAITPSLSTAGGGGGGVRPKMDSSKSMPQLASVGPGLRAGGGIKEEVCMKKEGAAVGSVAGVKKEESLSSQSSGGARQKEPKDRRESKGKESKDRKDARRDPKDRREPNSKPKERKETTFKDTPRDRDCESQASFSSKESGPSTTSSVTSKGRSPDHDPATSRYRQNVFVDWAPAWKGSGEGQGSGGGFRPQWPPVIRDGSTGSASSHPARGSNPAIDALGLGSGRLGSSSSGDGVGARSRSRPSHPSASNLRPGGSGSNSSLYSNGNGNSSPNASSSQAHRPKSYQSKESRHDKDSGDFYTKNPLEHSGRGGAREGGAREGVAVAGGRGQWQGSEVRGQHPSISEEDSPTTSSQPPTRRLPPSRQISAPLPHSLRGGFRHSYHPDTLSASATSSSLSPSGLGSISHLHPSLPSQDYPHPSSSGSGSISGSISTSGYHHSPPPSQDYHSQASYPPSRRHRGGYNPVPTHDSPGSPSSPLGPTANTPGASSYRGYDPLPSRDPLSPSYESESYDNYENISGGYNPVPTHDPLSPISPISGHGQQQYSDQYSPGQYPSEQYSSTQYPSDQYSPTSPQYGTPSYERSPSYPSPHDPISSSSSSAATAGYFSPQRQSSEEIPMTYRGSTARMDSAGSSSSNPRSRTSVEFLTDQDGTNV